MSFPVEILLRKVDGRKLGIWHLRNVIIYLFYDVGRTFNNKECKPCRHYVIKWVPFQHLFTDVSDLETVFFFLV